MRSGQNDIICGQRVYNNNTIVCIPHGLQCAMTIKNYSNSFMDKKPSQVSPLAACVAVYRERNSLSLYIVVISQRETTDGQSPARLYYGIIITIVILLRTHNIIIIPNNIIL